MFPFLSSVPFDTGSSLTFIQTIKDATNQDLTALGSIDWKHWGGFSLFASIDKTGGVGISDLTAIGSISNDGGATARTVTASDPTLSSADSGIYVGANGTTGWGVSLTVDASSSVRTCYMLLGQFSGAIKIDIRLSDDSATPISYTYSPTSIYTTEGLLVEFDYSCATAGQTAIVEITLSTNIDFGRFGVQAIAIS